MDLKFLIVLPYYKRPKMVINALDSLKNSSYTNWELAFIDDSGDQEFKETLEAYNFSEYKYTPTLDSKEDKAKQGGSRVGKYMNEAILASDADVIVILCDDDAVRPNYLRDLNSFYQDNPLVGWSYSHVLLFNPTDGPPTDESSFYNHPLNIYTHPINPYCKVDASQVTFRKSFFTKTNGFPHPRTKDLDAALYQDMFIVNGDCPFNYIIGQYKAWFNDQLGSRQDEYTVTNI